MAADRYFALIEATLRAAVQDRQTPGESELPRGDFSMERLVPLIAMRFGERGKVSEDQLQQIAADFVAASRIVDRADHSRPVYAALAVRALSKAGIGGAAVDHFAAKQMDSVRQLADGSMPIRAANGQAVIAAVFAAWALAIETVNELCAAALRRLVEAQQPDGTFLARTEADAPEPRWYDELAILHALHCYAIDSGERSVTESVSRAVRYHAAETQPDHASNHPWAIAAFLNEPDAVPLADMMLHAAGVQSPRTMDAVSLLLLADAIDCGRRRATR